MPPIRCVSQCNKVSPMSCRSSPQVDNNRRQDNAAPSLRSHYKSFITTTGDSVPRSGIGILPHGVCHLSFPFASETRFSRSVPKPVLRSCRLYTGCHRARKQISSRLIPEHMGDPSFDSTFPYNDASSIGLLALIFSIPTCHPQRMTFPQSLTTTPFERSSTGRFEACSCKPTSGGQLPSLVQHHELSLVFVTHPMNMGYRRLR